MNTPIPLSQRKALLLAIKKTMEESLAMNERTIHVDKYMRIASQLGFSGITRTEALNWAKSQLQRNSEYDS